MKTEFLNRVHEQCPGKLELLPTLAIGAPYGFCLDFLPAGDPLTSVSLYPENSNSKPPMNNSD